MPDDATAPSPARETLIVDLAPQGGGSPAHNGAVVTMLAVADEVIALDDNADVALRTEFERGVDIVLDFLLGGTTATLVR